MASLPELKRTATPQEQHSTGKCGLRTIPFIIANEALEKVSSSGLQTNMIVYLTREYHMGAAAAATALFVWGGVANVLPIFGAFLSDSCFGRFRMIAFGSILCLMGTTMLWLTALFPGAKPPPCNFDTTAASDRNCSPATPPQLILLFAALALVGVGSAGIRPCSISFGADQLAHQSRSSTTPLSRREKTLQAYFNWYYASVGVAYMFSSTVIVYIQDKVGWKVGFGVPAVLMALSALAFMLGSPLYVKLKSRKSILTEFAQVLSAAVRNRRRSLPRENLAANYRQGKSSSFMLPSNKLSFFNKACLVKNPEKELTIEGVASDPWRLCTVEQVEDFKSVIRVIPLWSTGIMVSLVLSQNFPVLQAEAMDRRIGRKFQIPAASLNVFQLVAFTLWSGCYDRFIRPLLARIAGKPAGLGLRQRMGVGILLAAAATPVAAAVEAVRRKKAAGEGSPGEPAAEASMSAMWLVLQYAVLGLAEAFTVIAQVEFFYSELPKSMNSFAVALWTLGLGVANMVGTLIVKAVDAITGGDGRESWLSSDVNKGHYDYYYVVLTLLGVANFFYFLVCSRAYGEEGKKRPWEVQVEVEEEIP